MGNRSLSLNEIPTVVITSVLCDIASDPHIGRPLKENVKRNRRVLGCFWHSGRSGDWWVADEEDGGDAVCLVDGGRYQNFSGVCVGPLARDPARGGCCLRKMYHIISSHCFDTPRPRRKDY